MNTFSINQATQAYVANAYKASIVSSDAVGTVAVKKSADNDLYFQQVGAAGLVRSDLIPISNIMSAKATAAAAMARKLKTQTITLDPSVNSGAPLAGQDYIMNIEYRQYISGSDDSLFYKFAAVHAYTGMTASDFYKKLAISLAKNLSRDAVKTITVFINTATVGETPATETEVTGLTKEAALTGTYVSITVKEVKQDWVLGMIQDVPVYFTCIPTTIKIDGTDVKWGTVAEGTGDTITNGEKTADYEYYFMGARGDEYRNVGFPNVMHTTYLVDSTKTYNYIDIHYFYTGPDEGSQKSEKDIVLVVPVDTNNATTNAIIGAINTAVGSTLITTLS